MLTMEAQGAERERAGGLPAAQALTQGAEHDHLERDVDAQHGERRDREGDRGVHVDEQGDDRRRRAGGTMRALRGTFVLGLTLASQR